MTQGNVQEAVKSTLLQLGIDASDPIASQEQFKAIRDVVALMADPEFKKDLQSIREWRLAQENIKRAGLVALVTAVVAGVVTWIVWSFKTAIHLKTGGGG